ncbi:hypothetical protein [Kribbella catacumbae]|uniref:hypothetical protein n=1 Tax=Kribbella catacumbae TaxID=460086 RepID=UPI00036069B9|nr:hypothetical protein [Kribbella catacumbae]
MTDQPKPGAEAPIPDRPGPEDVPDGISSAKVLYLDFDGIRYDKLLQASTPR